MEIQIESGVPVPRGNIGNSIFGAMAQLGVGDSFLIDKKRRSNIGTYFQRLAPKKFISRTVSETHCRVWRTA